MTTVERKGGFITTYTGKRFYPFDPHPDDIDINDIVHALAHVCRFAGHSCQFYSVAQHSVLVSLMSPDEDALWGLLHDASEAYLADVPSPLKKCPEFAFYREVEAGLMAIICDKFKLSRDEPPSVKLADKRVLATEARDLTMIEGCLTIDAKPYDFHIEPWAPERAKIKYMSRLHELTLRRI
jgi:5'-deoxynucleotidase YfbR-like HD superfamily hydrolase